jgi:hypothetical protein
MSIMLSSRLMQGFTWTKPSEVTDIDLRESKHNLYMEIPFMLHAELRLPVHPYQCRRAN